MSRIIEKYLDPRGMWFKTDTESREIAAVCITPYLKEHEVAVLIAAAGWSTWGVGTTVESAFEVLLKNSHFMGCPPRLYGCMSAYESGKKHDL